MNSLAQLLSIVWILAFMSPLFAIVCTTIFYARYCRMRPESERRITGGAYSVVLLVCAVVVYPFGIKLGINWACPSAGNLCGLAGFFVVGPLVSALAIVLVGGLITSWGSDWKPFR